MPTQEQVKDWKKRVEEANGALTFLPENLKEKAAAVEALRTAFNDKAKAMSKDEIELRVAQENFLLKLRQSLEESDKDVWLKDIAMLGEALEDGVYIVHLVEPRPRGV